MVVLDRGDRDVDLVHVLPDDQATLLFTVAPGSRLSAGGAIESGGGSLVLLGPPTRAYSRRFVDVPLTIVVTFKPAGAYLVSRAPMSQVTDTGVGLQAFIGDAAQRLNSALSRAGSNAQRLDRLERFLIERLDGCSGRALRATHVVDHAFVQLQRRCAADARPDCDPIEGGALATSGRQLRRLFKAVVGLNPHALVRIERFHRALQLARTTSVPQWADIAARCGYFDQSHLIADFNYFGGAPPRRMLRLLGSGMPHLQGSWFSENTA